MISRYNSAPLHTARSTIAYLQVRMSPSLSRICGSSNSLNLNPTDYVIWQALHARVSKGQEVRHRWSVEADDRAGVARTVIRALHWSQHVERRCLRGSEWRTRWTHALLYCKLLSLTFIEMHVFSEVQQTAVAYIRLSLRIYCNVFALLKKLVIGLEYRSWKPHRRWHALLLKSYHDVTNRQTDDDDNDTLTWHKS